MTFELGVIVLLFGCPLLTALLIFGIPKMLGKGKEQDSANYPARFKSPRLANRHSFRYRRR